MGSLTQQIASNLDANTAGNVNWGDPTQWAKGVTKGAWDWNKQNANSLLNGGPKLDTSTMPQAPPMPSATDFSDMFFKNMQESKWNTLLGGGSRGASFLSGSPTPPSAMNKSILGS